MYANPPIEHPFTNDVVPLEEQLEKLDLKDVEKQYPQRPEDLESYTGRILEHPNGNLCFRPLSIAV